MLLLLSALLFLLIIISYFFSRRDIISPTFLLSFSFFVVVFIAYMFEKELGGDIHGHTVEKEWLLEIDNVFLYEISIFS